ncbi:hypothetical protein EVB91_089 [Rhizobium phage RHph_I1_18]|nr:hypothetical protein EVB91_089 [Rhizobium phage RHph_I1_18]
MNISRFFKMFGRRKAGSWGKPHKQLRTDANRATRTIVKRLTKMEASND